MKKTISLVSILVFTLSAEIANADFTFGEPTNLGPTVNSSSDDNAPSISADSLAIFFCDYPNHRSGGYGDTDMWITTRTTTSDPWSTPVNLGSTVNSSIRDSAPGISTDGCSLYFDRYNGKGNMDVWVTTRASISEPWGRPINLGSTINTSYWDGGPSISADAILLL